MLGKGGRSAQLPPAGFLLLGNAQGPPQFRLGTFAATQRQEHLAAQPMQLGGKKPLVASLRGSNGPIEQGKTDLRLPEIGMG